MDSLTVVAASLFEGAGVVKPREGVEMLKMRVALLLCAVFAMSVGVASATADHGNGGNSANAKLCQKGGWMSLFRQDGSPFASEEDCVSYAAQGGTLSTTGAGCVVTATSGCLTFDNVVLPSLDGSGATVTVNGQFSFNTTCNFADANSVCPPSTLNNYATGSGTYVIKDASGAVVEQGTLTTADTAGSAFEGLAEAQYTDANFNPTSCSAATTRNVVVFASTGVASDPYVALGGFTNSSDPSSNDAIFSTISGAFFEAQPPAGFTLSC